MRILDTFRPSQETQRFAGSLRPHWRALLFVSFFLIFCAVPCSAKPLPPDALTLDLTSYGAVGDGLTDDGPALQDALDALLNAGGGTLHVPSGRYAIHTPVNVDFTGRAARLSIQGEPSSDPPEFGGNAEGLNLSSEFVIATGETADALRLTGLDALLIEDMVFIGVPGALTDARVTLNLSEIEDATVHRCEFYGLASMVEDGAIIRAYDTALNIDGSYFLGCSTSSALQTSLVQNILWKEVSISGSKFIDFGKRSDFYSKTVQSSPYSWIAIKTPAPRSNLSPRREARMRHVILDEGALMGITCLSATPIDLLFISDLKMNVSNLGAFGIYADNVKDLLIDRSNFGWSHSALAAILLGAVDDAILSNLECTASADRISISQATRRLTVINSVYNLLDSQAQTTNILTTTEERDPARYLDQQYLTAARRLPDPAAAMFWTGRLAACADDDECLSPLRASLQGYLASDPPENFNISGRIIDSQGAGIEGVTLSLGGLQQALTTATDMDGNFIFARLPTSGSYTVTPAQSHFAYTPSQSLFEIVSGDRIANFHATEVHSISGRITHSNGPSIEGVTVALTGSQDAVAITDINGDYSFQNLPADGSYTVTPARAGYTYQHSSQFFDGLPGDQIANFTQSIHINGRITDEEGQPLSGVTVMLGGSANLSATTDAEGDYSFADLADNRGYTYTIAPFKNNYAFSPQSQTVTYQEPGSKTLDFTGATQTYNIHGRVMAGETPLGGLLVQLSGALDQETTTDANGYYSFNARVGGPYHVSIAQTQFYSFAAQDILALNSDLLINLSGTARLYRIRGQVTDTAGGPLGGVNVNLNGSLVRATTTNALGEYSFDDVAAGGDYTVTLLDTPFYTFASQSLYHLDGSQVQNFKGALKSYTISGRVSEGQKGLGGVTVSLKGAQPERTTLTDDTGNYSFADVPASGSYTVKASKAYFTFSPDGQSLNNLGANERADFAAAQEARVILFGARDYTASEGAGSFVLNITRTGDPSSAASVDYRTSDGTASQRTDYTTVSGTLNFAPGESSKSLSVSLIDNAFVDGSRTVKLTLSNPRGGTLDARGEAWLTITDNDTAQPVSNPIDVTQTFVRQQYLDFLNREPDSGGMRYWSSQITQCGADAKCIHDRRVAVADAFFFEAEFQKTGAFVYRVYKAAFGARPTYAQFMADRGRIVSGALLDQSKSAYALIFVARDEFTSQYPRSLSADNFLNALLASIKQNSGVDMSAERASLLSLYDGTDAGRASILRQISDAQSFQDAEYNRSFVLMEYFGYLRRDPDQGGYDFWLAQVNKYPLRDVNIQHAMACSFITSAEYQTRFSTIQTSSNQMCPTR